MSVNTSCCSQCCHFQFPTSGVRRPTGVSLGSPPFSAINGISEVQLSDGTLILFTDNILLFRPVHSAVDIELLQEDVNTLFNWLEETFFALMLKSVSSC